MFKKKDFRYVIGSILLSVSSVTVADLPATELALVEADAWRARMGFHLLSIRGDNPDDRRDLEVLLEESALKVDALVAAATPSDEDNITAIEAAWVALSERAMDNPLASLGYADYSAMSEMNTTTLAVSELVGKSAALEQAYLDICQLSVDMQKLASEYVALAAFPPAGLPTGTELPPLDFALAAKNIDDQLVSLKEKYKSDSDASQVLAFVDHRWMFIRKTVPKMSENDANKVPYLFYRYASQIAERVEDLIEQAAAG